MTKEAPAKPAGTSTGFWRLQHEHLAAFLARADLSWELARVYLALADLTFGYGRSRDTVSIGQIADHAGQLRRPHVVRALHALAERGLYGQAPTTGQAVVRWVVWPPPAVPAAGNTTATVPALGNSTVPTEGNGTVPKAVPAAGKHQDTKMDKKGKKKARAADKPPPVDATETKALNNGALVALFCDLFREKVGEPFTGHCAKLGGNVKRLVKAHGADEVQTRLRRWFAAPRPDYGPELFIVRFQSAELRGAGQGALSGSEDLARKTWHQLESNS